MADQRRGERRVMLRYALFQVPGALIVATLATAATRWWDLPVAFAVGTVVLWLLKDAVLYPFVRRAYEPDGPPDHVDLIGSRGTTTEQLDPDGYVRVGSELWRARRAGEGPPLEPGSRVRVRALRDLTLLVEADDEPD